jgi:hypothetical protein
MDTTASTGLTPSIVIIVPGFAPDWMSPDHSGASHGFVAAGGPGLNGAMDLEGDCSASHHPATSTAAP